VNSCAQKHLQLIKNNEKETPTESQQLEEKGPTVVMLQVHQHGVKFPPCCCIHNTTTDLERTFGQWNKHDLIEQGVESSRK